MSVAVIGQGSPISRRSVTKHRNIYLAAAASIILLLALLPFFSWIHLTQADALFSLMKLKASAAKKLNSGYSVFTFLSFVQESKQGILGLWSFVLLLIAAAFLMRPPAQDPGRGNALDVRGKGIPPC